jgi:hypothetical protein
MTRTLVTLLLGTVLTASLLTGCGSSGNGISSKSAHEILAASQTAATDATSVHVISNSTIKGAGGPFSMDIHLTHDGAHGRVTLFGVSFEVIRIGSTIYVKGSPAFDAHLSANTGLHLPPNTWLKGPAQNSQLAQLGELAELRGELTRILGVTGQLTKGPNITINGQPTITLKETVRLYTGLANIATTGQPYPIQIIKHGQETGRTTFTDWNQPVTLTPPANAIDISQLEHKQAG